MKFLKIFFIFLIFIKKLMCYYGPETFSIGDGFVSDIKNVNSVFLNPAGLSQCQFDQFAFSIIKPFKFYAFSIIFNLKNFKIGSAIIENNEDFYSYLFGTSFIFFDFINSGINLALNREMLTNKKENFGFSVSPGLQLNIKEFSDDSPYQLKIGLYLKNILGIKKLESYREFMDFDIKCGINFKIFFEPVSFYIGNDKNFDFSLGINFEPFNFLNFQIGYKKEDNLLSGLKIVKNENNFSFGISYNTKTQTKNYIFSYIKSFQTIPKKILESKFTRKVGSGILKMQKKLLEEGLNYYREKDYMNAKKKWVECYNLAPESNYGKEAKNYIEKVNKILEKIKE